MSELWELNDIEYLKNLAERIRHIPVMFHVDGFDIDRLEQIAEKLKGVSND